MIYNTIYYLLSQYNIKIYNNNLNVTLFAGVIIYIILLHVSKIFQFYSSLIITIDLFLLKKNITKNNKKYIEVNSKNKNKIDSNKKKHIIKNITELIYNYFYNPNNKKNKYKLKKLDIKDTIEHTLENIKN